MKLSIWAHAFIILFAFNPLSCGSSSNNDDNPAPTAPLVDNGDGQGKNPPGPNPPTPTPPSPPPVIGQKVVWSDISKTIEDKCVKCHKPNGKRPLDTPALAWANHTRSEVLSDIANALNNGSMPPANQPQLSDTEKSVLLKWVNDGGLE
jgi:hypothetical protein